MSATGNYVLITPARNEAEFIELTIQSVIAQTLLPKKWVIVSDGSTDGTDEIVSKYTSANPWIVLLRMPEREERDFASKVRAFNAGYAALGDTEYWALGSLDGDISFDGEYFNFLLEKLAADPKLGLVGTPFDDKGKTYDYRFVSIEHVSGACQLFRRECFEAIGGYSPVKGGGIDHIAVMAARIKGWKTRTFTEKICVHHRRMGSAEHSVLAAKFRNGIKDYRLGSHPLWQLFRMAYQMTQKPLLVGGMSQAAGYFWAMACGFEQPVSVEMVKFRRSEEMSRLRAFFFGTRADVRASCCRQ